MKKIYSTLFAVLATGLTVVSYGQSQRLVMVDHFTQASCGPCASQNPALEATLNANSGTVIAVKHQVSWPGVDPMNAHYPAGPEDRRNYYGVTGVPNTCLDGAGPGAPNTVVTTATIGARAAVPSPFTLAVSHTVAGGAIDVTVDATCTQAVSGDLRLFIAVVENEIVFSTPPGSNGETEFYNVLKQYLGGTSGATIAGSWVPTDTDTYTDSWTYTNVYDENQLAVVAWIQDYTTGEIHQAGYSAPIPQYTLNATAYSLSDIPNEVCDGSIAPSVTIRNTGGTALTSLTIDYDVNGTAATPYTWNGNLPFLGSETVTLPALAFTTQATNTLNVSISSPNGGTDENANDNDLSDTFDQAELGNENVQLTIVPDNYGSEITWEVKNSGGTTLYSGGPYTDGQTTPQVVDMTFTADDCYEFNIFDSFGDGICCSWGNGSYTLTSGSVTLLSGGEYADEDNRLFRVDVASIEEQSLENLSIYPNPATDVLNVSFDTEGASTVAILDLQGRTIASQAGTNVSFPVAELAAGSYMVSITTENGVYTQNVVIK